METTGLVRTSVARTEQRTERQTVAQTGRKAVAPTEPHGGEPTEKPDGNAARYLSASVSSDEVTGSAVRRAAAPPH